MRTFQIIWPDTYKATEQELRTMYADAKANGQIDSGPDSDDIDDVVGALEYAGIITTSTKDFKTDYGWERG